MSKIGIFGGTFDPIHHGHLILAREARETLGLDRVIFIPAGASPQKLDQSSRARVRLEMLCTAMRRARFGFDTDGARGPPPSYAIETIEALRRREPAAGFFYFIVKTTSPASRAGIVCGAFGKVRFVVLNRSGGTAGHPISRSTAPGYSATNIRNRVATGRSIRYLVPPAVEKIIHDRRLYREMQK